MKFEIHRSKFAPASAISISIDAPHLNWFVLQKLKTEKPCGCLELAYSSEYTALVYSIFDAIRNILVGTADKQMKSKVNSIDCGMCHNNFVISFTCHSSLTAIRKSTGLAMSKLNPAKLYPIYQKYIKLLGASPKRAEFISCVNKIGQIKPSVIVVSKANVKQNVIPKMVATISKKLYKFAKITGGVTPESAQKTPGVTEFVTISPSGFGIALVVEFLDSINVPAIKANDEIIIFSNKLPNIKAKSIDLFTKKTYSKMNDKLTNAILYSVISKPVLCYGHINSLISANLTPAKISKILKSALL